jgi:hypothetical protein
LYSPLCHIRDLYLLCVWQILNTLMCSLNLVLNVRPI